MTLIGAVRELVAFGDLAPEILVRYGCVDTLRARSGDEREVSILDEPTHL